MVQHRKVSARKCVAPVVTPPHPWQVQDGDGKQVEREQMIGRDERRRRCCTCVTEMSIVEVWSLVRVRKAAT